MPETYELVCHEEGVRVDAYLASLRKDWSRSQIQKLIKEGHVLVNGAAVRASAKLRYGDSIRLFIPESPPADVIPEDRTLDVVYDDEHIIVVDKPPYLTVHPAPGRWRGTLVNALLARYPEIANVGSEKRPGIVHRLDADTSGLMVAARSATAYQDLIMQIQRREMTKVYLTLVRGHPDPPNGTIDAPVGRHPVDRKRMSVVSSGLQAVTEYRTMRRFKGFALLEAQIYTGRTHQIRVHMSAIGHPVAGDPRYGGRVPFLKRQFLHAYRLGFRHPVTGAHVEFVTQLHPDLEEALEGLEPLG